MAGDRSPFLAAPKRPAIFASAFHPSVGGVEELVRQLCHAYRGDGLEPIVLVNRWPRSLPAYEEVEGIPVYRFAMRVWTSAMKAKLSYALTHRSVRRQIIRTLQQHQADVLHVQCVSCNAHYAIQAKRALGLPLITTLQGELTMDASGLFQRSRQAQKLMRRALAEADAITACSRQTLEEAEAFFGGPLKASRHVIYNGVDVEEFQAVEPYAWPRPYILGIGRHVHQKGFDLLIRAYASLISRHADGPDLILAGDGTEHTALRRLAQEAGLGERVHFPGRVDHAQAVRLFKGCAFFVLPSRHEPFGIVNLEAMAAGRPVIAARVGGVPEFVEDGVNGLLVKPDHVEALTAAMGRLLADPGLQKNLAAAGSQRVRDFTWSSIAREYQQVYARVLGAPMLSQTTPAEAKAAL